jgi:hypothetical protein
MIRMILMAGAAGLGVMFAPRDGSAISNRGHPANSSGTGGSAGGRVRRPIEASKKR